MTVASGFRTYDLPHREHLPLQLEQIPYELLNNLVSWFSTFTLKNENKVTYTE